MNTIQEIYQKARPYLVKSQELDKLRKELGPAKARLIEIQGETAILLANDTDAADSVVKKLTPLRCESELLQQRLIRNARKLADLFVENIGDSITAAQGGKETKLAALQNEKLAFQETCIADYGIKNRSKGVEISKNRTFSPYTLREADRAYREAQEVVGIISKLRRAVDSKYFYSTKGAALSLVPDPDFNANIMLLVPELDGLLPPSHPATGHTMLKFA